MRYVSFKRARARSSIFFFFFSQFLQFFNFNGKWNMSNIAAPRASTAGNFLSLFIHKFRLLNFLIIIQKNFIYIEYCYTRVYNILNSQNFQTYLYNVHVYFSLLPPLYIYSSKDLAILLRNLSRNFCFTAERSLPGGIDRSLNGSILLQIMHFYRERELYYTPSYASCIYMSEARLRYT